MLNMSTMLLGGRSYGSGVGYGEMVVEGSNAALRKL